MGGWVSEHPSRSGEKDGRQDRIARDAATSEVGGEPTIGGSGDTARTRRAAVGRNHVGDVRGLLLRGHERAVSEGRTLVRAGGVKTSK